MFVRKKKLITIISASIVILAVVIGVFFKIADNRMNMIPHMSFESMLAYTTKDNKNAVISVGIIQNGRVSFTVYGDNSAVLPQTEHVYEIGSLTKTFTTSLLFKAVGEGKIGVDDNIDKYLDLPEKAYYPTIKRLITHTSGYKAYYFEPQMASNFLHGRNDFFGITGEQLISKVGKINLEDRDYDFKYSNFGISVTGAVLAKIYGEDYPTLMDNYISQELDLQHTEISTGEGDLGSYWDWAKNDAYMPAGALTSSITDMLKYAQLQMNETPAYLSMTHMALAKVNASSAREEKLNIRVDSVGAGWMIDEKNNIIWHNGGTKNYNCYLGFDRDKKLAVVILSNISPNYRIPATVMGVKLLTDLQTNAG